MSTNASHQLTRSLHRSPPVAWAALCVGMLARAYRGASSRLPMAMKELPVKMPVKKRAKPLRSPAVVLPLTLLIACSEVGHGQPPAANAPVAASLSAEARWLRRPRAERFQAADADWLEAFSAALRRELVGDHDAWTALGLEVRRRDGVLWLREAAPASGRGAFAVRHDLVQHDPGPGDSGLHDSGLHDSARRILVQAPHGDTDRGTRQLALLMFQEQRLLGLSLNSARRDTAPEADLARGEDNGFVRIAQVLAERRRDMRTVQLHGFSANTARQLSLPDDAIVVGGAAAGDPDLAAVARCLREAGFAAQDANERTRSLAGRGNPVGRALRREPPARFVHLELGPALRERLLADARARQALTQCL